MAHSRGLSLDFEILKRLSRDRLIRILEEAPGPKELIIDGELMKLLDRIADANTLRNHGVGKMYKFERLPPASSASQVVYLLRPTLVNIKAMADHAHSLLRQTQDQLMIHLVCVPRIVSWATLLLEEEGLHGIISLHEFTPEFIALDEDILSLEMQSFFRDAFIDGDFSGCVAVARALTTLQSLYGRFPNVLAHGRAAHAVYNALKILEEDQKIDRSSSSSDSMLEGQIGHVFILDRDADFVTPLLTQLTYEGTLDEHFGIRAGVVELPKEVGGGEQPLKVALNSRDTIFDTIRNRHFAGVAGHLARRARELQGQKNATATMSAAQIKTFVTNDLRTLQALQKSLSLHISACEVITKATKQDFEAQLVTEHGLITGGVEISAARAYLEDCIARQVPSRASLRLLCLFSIRQKGLSRREFEPLATAFLNAYGHSHAITLLRLRQAGLLLLQEEESGGGMLKQVSSWVWRPSGQWQALTRRLNLVPEEEECIDLHNPTHMSYIFNGAYTPAVPRLLQEALSKGVGAIGDALKHIPGSTTVRKPSSSVDEGTTKKQVPPRVVLVLVLGGITYAEIAAFRLLGSLTSTRLLVASTCTITGSALVGAAIQT